MNVKPVMPREMRDTGLILYSVIASRGIDGNQCTLHHQSKVEDHWNFQLPRGRDKQPVDSSDFKDPCDMRGDEEREREAKNR